MNIRASKKPALILTAIIIISIVFWPLPAQFKYIGSQFITFVLALYIGLRVWRSSPKGQWLRELQNNAKFGWVIYLGILLFSAAITYATISTLGYWPRAIIEFILVIGIVYYALREFKRFLI
ncbi:hypothetical protein MNBD_ALPHA03-1698 [hydrothermal vent metagenome]|uniref:Uncharacterized protein n=1 Tax=hydrothermal vent metagenome TaxID=652676 RepID=A0A3B1BHJ4_9ZZZZ